MFASQVAEITGMNPCTLPSLLFFKSSLNHNRHGDTRLYSTSTWKMEAGEQRIRGQPGLYSYTLSQKKKKKRES
jgi:hypothetical protein